MELAANTNKTRKRVSRGGKRGKTCGRGHKGQKSRSGNSMRPQHRDTIQRIPKLRGHNKNRAQGVVYKNKVYGVNVSEIEKQFEENSVVEPKVLVKIGLARKISGKYPQIKILGSGEIKKKVVVKNCFVSKVANEKIIGVGGKIYA